MRLLHTSDWHLGHTLREWDRREEHEAFLLWLLEIVEAEKVDALLIAGDVFETSNPSAHALEQWFRFLAQARARRPEMDVVAIGGNHDSPGRLDAPSAVFRALRMHVVGGVPPRCDGRLDVERLLLPLCIRGEVRAWVAAVPFLRPSDLVVPEGGSPAAGVASLYEEIFEAAGSKRKTGEALVAMGHLYAVGGQVSELSERRILGGYQHAVPASLFPENLAYVALGHLHLAQAVGGRAHVRYSGSPLPLSTAEAHYPHQVVLVELEGERAVDVRALRVPLSVPFRRIPRSGAASVEEALDALRSLPKATSTKEDRWPFVEVHVRLDKPEPTLARRIEEAMDRRAARLVRVVRERGGGGEALFARASARTLDDLAPSEVFARIHEREHGRPPSETLLAAFHDLVEEVQGVRTP